MRPFTRNKSLLVAVLCAAVRASRHGIRAPRTPHYPIRAGLGWPHCWDKDHRRTAAAAPKRQGMLRTSPFHVGPALGPAPLHSLRPIASQHPTSARPSAVRNGETHSMCFAGRAAPPHAGQRVETGRGEAGGVAFSRPRAAGMLPAAGRWSAQTTSAAPQGSRLASGSILAYPPLTTLGLALGR